MKKIEILYSDPSEKIAKKRQWFGKGLYMADDFLTKLSVPQNALPGAESKKCKQVSSWPLFLLLATVPVGVAGQNVAMGVAFFFLWKQRKPGWTRLLQPYRMPIYLSFACIFWLLVVSLLNPLMASKASLGDFGGHLGWVLLPPVLVLGLHPLPNRFFGTTGDVIKITVIVWGLVVLSQILIGWRVSGYHVIADGIRPRGLYSHPLTLAYSALLFWPFIFLSLVREPRRLLHWFACLAMIIIIVGSLSRMIQAMAALIVVWTIFSHLQGWQRRWSVVLFAVFMVCFFVVPNPASHRILATFSTEGVDKVSNEYPDDRLAFWHAHWQMVQERPVVGHGTVTDTRYRTPYYQQIGLGEFLKKYEAHNTFLQVLVDGGVVGLALFLSWLVWHFRCFWNMPCSLMRTMGLQTLSVFCLASVSQNSFQDAEVRTGLSLLVAMGWLALVRGKSLQGNNGGVV